MEEEEEGENVHMSPQKGGEVRVMQKENIDLVFVPNIDCFVLKVKVTRGGSNAVCSPALISSFHPSQHSNSKVINSGRKVIRFLCKGSTL